MMTKADLNYIKRFASENWDLDDDDPNKIIADHEEFAVTNPWLDCSGRFALTDHEAVKEWGLATVIDFCEKVLKRR